MYLYCNDFKIVLKFNVTHYRVRQSNVQQPVASEAGRTTKSDFVFDGQQSVFKRRFNTLENYTRCKNFALTSLKYTIRSNAMSLDENTIRQSL